MSDKTQELSERLRQPFSGPMTVEEIDLLRDFQALIEFAIRNGLSFAVVAAALSQDINEIARAGFDLKTAKAHGFVPRAAGYGKVSEDDFGETEEEPAAWKSRY